VHLSSGQVCTCIVFKKTYRFYRLVKIKQQFHHWSRCTVQAAEHPAEECKSAVDKAMGKTYIDEFVHVCGAGIGDNIEVVRLNGCCYNN
jgi:hypothetical protein